jgi:ribosomal protein S18 acetylase RimI-like enzyme
MTDAPSHIRHATRGDLPEVVELLVTCDIDELGQADTSEEDVAADWNQQGFDLSTDAWVAEGAHGGMNGYAYVGDQMHNGEIEADFWIHPQADDPSLRNRLFGLIEHRAREIAAASAYGDTAALEICTLAADRPKLDLLAQHGFAPRRTVYRMRVDLPDDPAQTPVPTGLEIRPFREGVDERVVYDTMNDAFEDHIHHSSESFEAWRTRLLGHPDFDADLWLLAWDGDEVAGALIAYDHGELGWVKGLGVRRAWRCRGLGTAMLTHAFAAFVRRGQQRVELGVDAEGENRPLDVYETLGMQVVHAYELFEKRLAD